LVTSPDTFTRSIQATPFANGWLCFESTETKRRLAPIPTGWEFGTDESLEELCQQAAPVPLRRVGRFTA
jgi:hypothetical protein